MCVRLSICVVVVVVVWQCQVTKQSSTTQFSRSAELPELHLHPMLLVVRYKSQVGLNLEFQNFKAHTGFNFLQIKKPTWAFISSF